MEWFKDSGQFGKVVGIISVNSSEFVDEIFRCDQEYQVCTPLRSANDVSRIVASGVDKIIQPDNSTGWCQKDITLNYSNSPSLILFSSGTTGEAKGILLSQTCISSTAQRLIDIMEITDEIQEYIGVPVYYSFGMGRCRAVSAVGGKFYLPPNGFDPAEIASMLKNGEINAISAVPTLWRLFFQNESLIGNYGSGVRWIEIGSQYMSRQEKETLKRIFPNARIIQHYGLTEASRSTFLKIHETEGEALESVGRGYKPVEIKLSNDNRIMIKGPNLGREMLTGDESRPIPDQEGWLTTSDIGELRDGLLLYKGRADHIINYGGIKVDPEAIERQIHSLLNISQDLAVGGIPDEIRGEKLLVVYTADCNLSRDTIQSAVLSATENVGLLGSAAVEIRNIASIPETDTGKIQRGELKNQPAIHSANGNMNSNTKTRIIQSTGSELESDYTPPRSPIEEEVVRIWEETLGIDRVGVKNNFFALGGDSLSATRAVSRINEAFGIELSVGQLLESPTVRAVATCVFEHERYQ